MDSRDLLVIERLHQILKQEPNMSKAELSRAAGITAQGVNNWFKTGKVGVDSAAALSKYFNGKYSIQWILGRDENNNVSDGIGISNSKISNSPISNSVTKTTNYTNQEAGENALAQYEPDGIHHHRIDYLDVRAAAGLTGFENSDYPEIVSSLFLSDEGLLQIIGRKSAAGIKIVNVPTDSMEPTIRKSDWVLLDTNIDYYNGDGVYAFAIDGALFIKRIQKLVGGGYRLHSDNKDYDPQDISEDICQTAKFVGRFIKTIHIDVVSL